MLIKNFQIKIDGSPYDEIDNAVLKEPPMMLVEEEFRKYKEEETGEKKMVSQDNA